MPLDVRVINIGDIFPVGCYVGFLLARQTRRNRLAVLGEHGVLVIVLEIVCDKCRSFFTLRIHIDSNALFNIKELVLAAVVYAISDRSLLVLVEIERTRARDRYGGVVAVVYDIYSPEVTGSRDLELEVVAHHVYVDRSCGHIDVCDRECVRREVVGNSLGNLPLLRIRVKNNIIVVVLLVNPFIDSD